MSVTFRYKVFNFLYMLFIIVLLLKQFLLACKLLPFKIKFLDNGLDKFSAFGGIWRYTEANSNLESYGSSYFLQENHRGNKKSTNICLSTTSTTPMKVNLLINNIINCSDEEGQLVYQQHQLLR